MMEIESKTLESDRNENCAIESLPPPPSSSPKSSSLLNSLSFSSYEEEDYQEESKYTSESDFDSSTKDNEMEHAGDVETVDGDVKRMDKKSWMVCNEKDCQSSKLKFRRGKVVDMQSENKGPRSLKFRRGKVLAENPNVKLDARRRSFKRRDGVDDNRTETILEKVVLKHQDLQGKKQEQGMFNNVIEETASKLVETQKSKVKALVNACEMVISLQDSKPFAKTVI
ncbi:uncharacterized protein LOC107431875 [Ziziphus jujuba]|uniref:Uncharacterized protein LOC107431875 n=1 Tax=Ziziphus jujuba TaxID=326968 RepID=A0ABM3ZWI9_ZIZJJ|nr:uncharacterized protein LOC107431875 [Ziziphus jujuba]